METNITITRDCEVTEIPSGGQGKLAAGAPVRIVQTLGGSYTVANNWGQMFRVDAKDADALGFAPAEPQAAPTEFSEALVWNQLKTIYDPEIPVNIVDLGLVYGCQIAPLDGGHKIEVKMSVTAPGCGMGDVLRRDIETRLAALPAVKEVHVEVVLDPPWHPGLMTDAAKLQLGLL
jgi:probable FeS assembly SUF system protein SufT